MVVGVTIVAVGTSLPELVTVVISAIKKENEIIIGNLIGSNIFNIAFVGSTVATITTLPHQFSMNWPNHVIMMGIMAIAWIFMITKNIVSRVEGIILLTLYAGYIVYLLVF